MKGLRSDGDRLRGSFRLALGGMVTLVFMLVAQASSAAPRAWHVSFFGELYEFDVATGDYSLVHTFDPPIGCHQLTREGDTLFCADPEQFTGTWVRRLELSTASGGWQVNFPDLDFPDGIAYSDSLLYVVAHESQPRRYFLLTLEPSTGEELARVEISGLNTPFEVVYGMAARGPELWLLTNGDSVGMAVRRLDPLTGSLSDSFSVPGFFAADDADFDPFGRLVLSKWTWGPANTHWCTDYWIVPSLGELPDHQFTRCWFLGPGVPPPNLAYFTLAEGGAPPAAEIPTLGAAGVIVLVALLAMAGVLALRSSGRVSAG